MPCVQLELPARYLLFHHYAPALQKMYVFGSMTAYTRSMTVSEAALNHCLFSVSVWSVGLASLAAARQPQASRHASPAEMMCSFQACLPACRQPSAGMLLAPPPSQLPTIWAGQHGEPRMCKGKKQKEWMMAAGSAFLFSFFFYLPELLTDEVALPRLLYNSCFGTQEAGAGSRWVRYSLNSGGLVLPRPGSIRKTHHFPFHIPWRGGRTWLPRQGAAPPTAVTPRYWHNVGLACEKKHVSNPKGPPPSTERTGPPSQGSQTINTPSLLSRDAYLKFTGKAAPWGVCWLRKEVWFSSFPGDPDSPLVNSAGTQLSQTSSAAARTSEEVHPRTASHLHPLAAVYRSPCCARVRNCDTVW